MDQFDWRTCLSSHPAVAALHHHDNQRIKIHALFGQPILEPGWPFFIGDAAQDSVADKLVQSIGEAMRRQAQVVLNTLESADAEEDVADDEHRPAIADD